MKDKKEEEIPEEIHRKASILSRALMDLPPQTQENMLAERRGEYKIRSKGEMKDM